MKFFNIALITAILFYSSHSQALTIKVAVIAPEGTTWAKNLKKMAKEIKKNTDVKFKIYFGGVQGDEPDVLRKIRVGQIHGGIFTGKTLGDIYGDIRVIEIPFNFYENRTKAWSTVKEMTPYFDKGIKEEGFFNLGFFEIGQVYVVSKKETKNLKGMESQKIWAWEGDQLVSEMIKSLNLISVPLPLPDVLSSLSTGIIHAAYAPPMGIMALQWNTKVKYLVNFPVSFSIGAFLIDQKVWKKVSSKDKKYINQATKKYFKEINESTVADNLKAMSLMKTQGVQFIEFPKSDTSKSGELRKKIITKLEGKLFSTKAVKMLEQKIR